MHAFVGTSMLGHFTHGIPTNFHQVVLSSTYRWEQGCPKPSQPQWNKFILSTNMSLTSCSPWHLTAKLLFFSNQGNNIGKWQGLSIYQEHFQQHHKMAPTAEAERKKNHGHPRAAQPLPALASSHIPWMSSEGWCGIPYPISGASNGDVHILIPGTCWVLFHRCD